MARVKLSEVRQRKAFYRDNYRRLVRFMYISMLALLGQTGVVYYLIVNKPEVNYYATNSNFIRTIVKLRPLPGPNRSEQPLLKPDPPEEVGVKTLDI